MRRGRVSALFALLPHILVRLWVAMRGVVVEPALAAPAVVGVADIAGSPGTDAREPAIAPVPLALGLPPHPPGGGHSSSGRFDPPEPGTPLACSGWGRCSSSCSAEPNTGVAFARQRSIRED